jgi:hypothetical protein
MTRGLNEYKNTFRDRIATGNLCTFEHIGSLHPGHLLPDVGKVFKVASSVDHRCSVIFGLKWLERSRSFTSFTLDLFDQP